MLKGPQSGCSTARAAGGVISIRTADPTNDFELIGRVAYEVEARERRAELIVSGPIAPTLKVRLAGTVGQQDGFFTNNAQAIPALGAKNPSSRRITPAKDYKVRATVLWNPSDMFDARLKLNRVYDTVDYSGSAQNVNCPAGPGPCSGASSSIPTTASPTATSR